jgi:hypothetical protein
MGMYTSLAYKETETHSIVSNVEYTFIAHPCSVGEEFSSFLVVDNPLCSPETLAKYIAALNLSNVNPRAQAFPGILNEVNTDNLQNSKIT